MEDGYPRGLGEIRTGKAILSGYVEMSGSSLFIKYPRLNALIVKIGLLFRFHAISSGTTWYLLACRFWKLYAGNFPTIVSSRMHPNAQIYRRPTGWPSIKNDEISP